MPCRGQPFSRITLVAPLHTHCRFSSDPHNSAQVDRHTSSSLCGPRIRPCRTSEDFILDFQYLVHLFLVFGYDESGIRMFDYERNFGWDGISSTLPPAPLRPPVWQLGPNPSGSSSPMIATLSPHFNPSLTKPRQRCFTCDSNPPRYSFAICRGPFGAAQPFPPIVSGCVADTSVTAQFAEVKLAPHAEEKLIFLPNTLLLRFYLS